MWAGCRAIWSLLIGLFRSRATLEAENLVLRQQILVLRRTAPKRLSFNALDTLILVALYRLFSDVRSALANVQLQSSQCRVASGKGRRQAGDNHAGSLRSGCNCHGPQRQPACLYYRDGDLRDRRRRVNVANPRPRSAFYWRDINQTRCSVAGDARDRNLGCSQLVRTFMPSS
jgi:hypothetical protein